MNWFYAQDGKPVGPVSEETLVQLLAQGVLGPGSLVWREGQANWQAIREVLPHLVVAPPAVPPVAPPAEAVSAIPAPEPSVAPTALAMAPSGPAAEGGSVRPFATPTPVPPHDGWLSEEELLATDYPVEIVESIRRGWATFFKNPGLLLGSSVVVWLLMIAASSVPLLGFLAQLAIYGPLLGGLWAIFLRVQRGQPAELGLAFGSFGPRFWQFVLAHLLPVVGNLVLMIPAMAFGFLLVIGTAAAGNAAGKPQSIDAVFGGLSVGMMVLGGTLLLVAAVAVWLIQLLWMFSVPLVADKGYDAIPAMRLSWKRVSRHLGWHLLFLLTLGLFSMLGVLALCVGLLVAAPVAFSAMGHWYENLFGRLRPAGPSLTR